MAQPLRRAVTTSLVRHQVAAKVWSDSRSFGSYTKTKSGVWVPRSAAPRSSRTDDVKTFFHNQWKKTDPRVRLTIVEFFTKSALFVFSGGSGAYLMKNTLDRLSKLEAAVEESDKDREELKKQVQIKSQYSEERFRAYGQASYDRYLQLTSELNELKVLRDIWLYSAYTENVLIPGPKEESAKKPTPKQAAIGKDASSKGKQESSRNENSSDDALSDVDKPAPEHLAAIGKDASKKSKQECPNNENNSDDVLSDVDETDEELRVIFELIDKDNDGYISVTELHDLFASMNEKKLSKDEIKKLINEAGYHVKGYISLPELRNLIGK